MELKAKLKNYTSKGLIDFAKQEYGLALDSGYTKAYMIELIIEADRRIKDEITRRKDEAIAHGGTGVSSQNAFDDYYENLAKENENRTLLAPTDSITDIQRRKLAKLKKAQGKIINDLESEGLLLYLLSKNELQEYGRNIGIELDLNLNENDLINQIESAERDLEGITSQDDKGFFSHWGTKKGRKASLAKANYANIAKRKLDKLKVAQEKVREDLKLIERQTQKKAEEEELEKSIQKYRAEATKAKREAARKAKDSLKKRFY